jgi:arylformamidase
MKIFDISPAISPELRVWPGDTPPSREVLRDMNDGGNLTLSTLRTTVHLGAHADAPSHYDAAGESIERRRLDYYLGPCQVVRVNPGRNGLVRREHVSGPIRAGRILFHTGTGTDPGQFPEDFAALSPDLVDRLNEQGVVLVGTDAASIDPFASKDLPAHRACLRHDMAILEGLALAEVPEGTYELIALPLKLTGFDASPVRAVLREID